MKAELGSFHQKLWRGLSDFFWWNEAGRTVGFAENSRFLSIELFIVYEPATWGCGLFSEVINAVSRDLCGW